MPNWMALTDEELNDKLNDTLNLLWDIPPGRDAQAMLGNKVLALMSLISHKQSMALMKWNKRLAIFTGVLAVATVALAIVSFLK